MFWGFVRGLERSKVVVKIGKKFVSLLAAVGWLRGCDAGMLKQHPETSVTSLSAATLRRLEYLFYTI